MWIFVLGSESLCLKCCSKLLYVVDLISFAVGSNRPHYYIDLVLVAAVAVEAIHNKHVFLV